MQFISKYPIIKLKVLRLLKYSLVGVATAAIYFFLYYIIKYLLFGTEVISNALAYLLAVIFQYNFQAKYTFSDIRKQNFRLQKFAIVTFIGYVFSILVTSYLVPSGYFSELIGVILIIFLLPLLNIILMFFWVFCAPIHK